MQFKSAYQTITAEIRSGLLSLPVILFVLYIDLKHNLELSAFL